MALTRFGGNEFGAFSVSLVFEDRYFVLEPGNPPLVTVFVERDGQPVFEVLKSQPRENTDTTASTNPTGIVTVTDKSSGSFLYKIRPGSETSVVFGKVDGNEISVRITDQSIQAGGTTVTKNVFAGGMAGVLICTDGSVTIGAPIPLLVQQWLSNH